MRKALRSELVICVDESSQKPFAFTFVFFSFFILSLLLKDPLKDERKTLISELAILKHKMMNTIYLRVPIEY